MTENKKKRGPEPKISIADQVEELINHPSIFDENYKLKTGKENEFMWRTICDILQEKLK